MPRKSRIDTPGALHHVIVRGIEKKRIFRDQHDYSVFVDRLGGILADTSTPCFAWAMMSNHVHILLRSGIYPVSTIMRRLLTSYAQYFNRRYNRHGHLFQNRYKSILCQEEPYLLELVRYIHLNPIRAKMVKQLSELNTYNRTGHAVIMGKITAPWQDVNYILRFFGKTQKAARKGYLEFIRKGLAQGRRPELTGGGLLRSHGGWSTLKAIRAAKQRVMGDERILGSSEFVETVLREADEQYDEQTLLAARQIDLEIILEKVGDYFEIDKELLKSRHRRIAYARARAICCYFLAGKLKKSNAEVSRILNISPSAVSRAVVRGKADIEAENVWEVIKNELI